MKLPINEIINKDWIEAAKGLPAGCVHCIITSPPYWGQRNYGVEDQLGLEKTPEEHIEKLVIGFRELRRILRDDGVVFLNYGDKYYAPSNFGGTQEGTDGVFGRKHEGLSGATGNKFEYPQRSDLKQGDLIGLAWRLALALQADGWILRSDIIWAKAISSFGMHACPHCGKELYQEIVGGQDLFGDDIEDEVINKKKSGSTMPESVNGWRWERCRVKVGGKGHKSGGLISGKEGFPSMNKIDLVEWQDCPGCEKCRPNGGYVLRRGSWRPTRSHEYLFLLAKTNNYYCDMEAVREDGIWQGVRKAGTPNKKENMDRGNAWEKFQREALGSRNLRDVWTINPQPYPDSHYATFPEALVEPCIKVGTSEKGCCPKCGAPWARVVDSKQIKRERPADRTDRHNQEGMNSCGNTVAGVETQTLGWKPTCDHKEEPVPCIVYDPFSGTCTVQAVAAKLGRNYCGSEISKDYLENQAKYRVQEAETGISKQELKSGQGALFEGIK